MQRNMLTGGGTDLPTQSRHGTWQELRRVQVVLQALIRHEVAHKACTAIKVVQLSVVQLLSKKTEGLRETGRNKAGRGNLPPHTPAHMPQPSPRQLSRT
eukprot:359006-Chlamydomonas_euryale.AAC.5